MPTLNWIGKDAVVEHHNDVPFRLLEPVTRRAGDGFGFVMPKQKDWSMIRAALSAGPLGQ